MKYKKINNFESVKNIGSGKSANPIGLGNRECFHRERVRTWNQQFLTLTIYNLPPLFDTDNGGGSM